MSHAFTLLELMIAIVIIAVIAAIAIPNFLESRIVSQEAGCAASMRSGIFPAQTLFQSSNYLDLNTDGIGDFSPQFTMLAGGPIAQLNGIPVTLSLLPTTWNAPNGSVRHGTYVFDLGADFQFGYVSTAWPSITDGSAGRRSFAINISGVVHCTPPIPPTSPISLSTPFGTNPYVTLQSGWVPFTR